MPKYKAIGWVVEWRSNLTDDWFAHPLDIRKTKTKAIDLFTGRKDSSSPKDKIRKGYSRCVRVYVEVKE